MKTRNSKLFLNQLVCIICKPNQSGLLICFWVSEDSNLVSVFKYFDFSFGFQFIAFSKQFMVSVFALLPTSLVQVNCMLPIFLLSHFFIKFWLIEFDFAWSKSHLNGKLSYYPPLSMRGRRLDLNSVVTFFSFFGSFEFMDHQ